jgi:outer membrane immunogenic protein
MKQIIKGRAGAAALLLTLLGGSAWAADLPRAPYYRAEGALGFFSWVGPYLGGNLGYEWGTTGNNPTRPTGIAGGIQGGYNWQSGQFVFGAEADIQLSAANDTFAPWKFSNPWFGTVRGRAGYAIHDLLLYGTAGLAFGELTGETVGLLSESHTNLGWTAGIGAEARLFRSNWSAKVEYLFVDLSSSTFTLTGVSNGLSASVFRAGVNYHF